MKEIREIVWYFINDFKGGYNFARLEYNDFWYGFKYGIKCAIKELKEYLNHKHDDYEF